MWKSGIFLAILCMPVLGFKAVAQTTTLPVRAGEHAVFTRLVIQLPEANDWRLTQDGHLAILSISGPALDFDLSQTFARIPRTRLASLQQTDTGLELRLACDCIVRASEDLPQYLVMDITEIEPPKARPAANTARPQTRPIQPQPVQSDVAGKTPDHVLAAGQTLANALTGRPVATQQRRSLLLSQIIGAPLEDVANLPENVPAQPAVSLEGMTQDLGRALSEAVGQGLLTPDHDIKPAPRPNTPVTEERPSRVATRQRTNASGHLTITDSVAAARGATPRSLQNDIFSMCPTPASIDPSQWGAEAPLLLAPHASAALYTEMDALDPDATRSLVKHSLYLGFGAEARQILSLIRPSRPEDMILESISYLVDLEPLPDRLAPLDIGACGGVAPLWQALATLPGPLPDNFPVAQLVQLLQALPAHLRLHLGPHVIRHLAAQGHVSQAHSIRDSLDRISETRSDPLRLAQATLDLPRVSGKDAESMEHDLLSEPTIESVTFLLQRQQDLQQPISSELADEAQSLLRALRGSDEGHTLSTLLARGLSRSERIGDALALVRMNDAGLPAPENESLREELLLDLAARADDTVFIKQIFEHTPWQLPLSTQGKNALATRLSSLGFDEQADLLTQPPAAIAGDATITDELPSPLLADAEPLRESSPQPEAANVAAPMPSASMPDDSAVISSAEPEFAETRLQDDIEIAQGTPQPDTDAFGVATGLLDAGRNTVLNSSLLRERLANGLLSTP